MTVRTLGTVNTKKWLIAGAAAVVVVGGLIAGVVSVATARPASTAAAGAGTSGTPQARPSGGSRGGGTVVTGDEATKVAAAVTAKDSAVTVSSVRKNADGSYLVLGTKAGQNVFYRVSADLATVTQAQGGGFGASGGPSSTAVTGDEETKVTAAVTAQDSTVTVTAVRKNADGSYTVRGTKAGQNVVYTVSADLGTVTLRG